MTTRAFQKIYTKIDNITKATVTLRATGVGNDELATVGGKLAQVVKIMGENVTLQIFAGTEGLSTDSEVVFHGEPPKLRVSDNLAGRFFNAYGEPLEGGGIIEGEAREIGGPTVNPFRRIQPSELIATGIAGIDLNNTIVTGQKIPFFADPDQPYNAVMANVALRAKADKIILGGMGLTNDDFLYFKSVFENAGALDRIVSFVNTTENPPVERLLVPRHGADRRRVLRRGQGREGAGAADRHDLVRRCPGHRVEPHGPDSVEGLDAGIVVFRSGEDLRKGRAAAQRRFDHDHRRDDLFGRRHHARHPRQYGLYHRGPVVPAQRFRHGQGHRRPVPFAVASETARHRQEDP